jgi:hypothetical protein
MRQSLEPASEEGLDVVGAQGVTDILERFGVLAGEEAVVEGLVADAFAVELTLGPFVAVEPDANGERCVGRELDEGEAEVAVEDIEVVLIDVNLAPVDPEARGAATGGVSSAAVEDLPGTCASPGPFLGRRQS